MNTVPGPGSYETTLINVYNFYQKLIEKTFS